MTKLSIKQRSICKKMERSHRQLQVFLAGAGCGKTETLKHFAQEQAKRGKRVLLLSFSNTAVREFEDRGASASFGSINLVTSTIHSFSWQGLTGHCAGLPIPKNDVGFLGYQQDYVVPPKPIFVDNDEDKGAGKRLKKLVEEHELQGDNLPSRCLKYLNKMFTDNQKPNWLVREGNDLLKLIDLYCQWKQDSHVIDYNDMVGLFWAVLKCDPKTRKQLPSWDWICVDEAQDVCQRKFDIIRWITSPETKLVIAGDPCQCAYIFAGAKLDIFDWLVDSYKRNFAKYTLSTSYRCSGPICALSNAITKKLPTKFKTKIKSAYAAKVIPLPKIVFHRDLRGEVIVVQAIQHLKQDKHLNYSDVAVQSRVVKHQRDIKALCKELSKEGIPFMTSHDEEELQIKIFLTQKALLVGSKKSSQDDLYEVLTKLFKLNMKEAKSLCYSNQHSNKNPNLVVELQQKAKSNYQAILKHLLRMMEKHKCKVQYVGEFFARYNSISEMENKWKDEVETFTDHLDVVKIITIHKFKGRQREAIIILDVSDGSIPHQTPTIAHNKNEERSLLNIAVTRASKYLLMFCQQKGASGIQCLSPYLYELLEKKEGYHSSQFFDVVVAESSLDWFKGS